MPLDIIHLDHPAVLATYERRLVLVRPDGHVAWRGERLDVDARAIVDQVRGCASNI
ncbi:hypothetical protein D3C83_139960 [compost metagenome]